jgi:hypothetical protein
VLGVADAEPGRDTAGFLFADFLRQRREADYVVALCNEFVIALDVVGNLLDSLAFAGLGYGDYGGHEF